MHRAFLVWMLTILSIVSVFAVPTSAQNTQATQTYTFPDGTSFLYPDYLKLDASQGNRISIYDARTASSYPKFSVEVVAGNNPDFLAGDLDQVTETYFNKYVEGKIVFQTSSINPKKIDIHADKGLYYTYNGMNTERAILIVVPLSGGSLGFVSAEYNKEWKESDVESVILEITQSLHTLADNAACTISTSISNSVAVRVGPGTNRTTFTYLPADEQFTVLGKAQAADESLWWQLDRQAVAPKKLAAQAWVLQSDVGAEGNCDIVSDVNAPPLIPIVTAQPQPATQPTPGAGVTSSTASSSTGTQPLTVRVICKPGVIYSGDFMVNNPNPFEVPVSFVLSTGLSGFFFARPGGDTNYSVGLQYGQYEVSFTIDWGSGTAVVSSRCGQTKP